MRFIFFLASIYILYNIFYREYKNSTECSEKLYVSCPSRKIINYCTGIQEKNHNQILQQVKNNTENSDEITKLILYSDIYSSMMEFCIRTIRLECRLNNCYFSNKKINTYSFVYSLQGESNKKLADRDECFLKVINFEEMYKKCHISLYRDECMLNYMSNKTIVC